MKDNEKLPDLPGGPPPSSGVKPTYRILVVDDEKAVRDLHLELLAGAGYEAVAVADGALAWNAIQAEHFDLMITDNSMPKVTGVELINKLIAAKTRLSVIMSTGALPYHEFRRYSWLNDIPILTKPVSGSVMLATIAKILSERKDFSDMKIDPTESAKIESPPPEVGSKEEGTTKPATTTDQVTILAARAPESSEAGAMRNIDVLRSSEIRYRRLFEAARDGILILDLETGRITDVNPFLIEILGFTKSEMLGRTVGELSPFKDIEPNQVMLGRLKQDGYVRYEHLPLENKDGQHIAVEFVCNVYQEDAAQVIQCNIRDITERKRAEDEKEKFSVELERRVVARTSDLEAFSGAVCHDLQAPLRHLTGYLEELREQTDPILSERSLELLTVSCQAAKRMANLIEDLLAFSRVDTAPVKKTVVNFDELVRQTLNDYSPEIENRQIEWNIHSLGEAEADPALLRLVFGNLVSNALKFTGGRAKAKIEIGCLRESTDEAVFYIRDNGAGFDPEYGEKLFGVFQRLHSQEEYEGTGLGLANIQRIILRHGGRVWAEGAVDEGAAFYFSLPHGV